MRLRRRTKRRIVVFSATVLAILVVLAFVVFRQKNVPDESKHPKASVNTPGVVRLGFTLPCAVYSADAESAYAAVRQRDSKTLMDLVSQRRLRMLHQGTDIVISPLQGLAVVDVVGDEHGGRTCYIPLEMIGVVQRNRAK